MILPESAGACYVPHYSPAGEHHLNWCDQRAIGYTCHGENDLGGIYMSPIQPSTIGIGGAIGRRALLDSSEIRMFIQNGTDSFQMNPGATIPGDSWIEGTGPNSAGVPTDIEFPPTYAPNIFELGAIPPLRLIVALDRQPTGQGTIEPDVDQVLDFTFASFPTMQGCPLNQNMRKRFLVVHDEVINPPLNSNFQLTRVINWKKLLGKEPVIQWRTATASSAYSGVATNAPIVWCGSGYYDGTGVAPEAVEFNIRTYYRDP